MHARWRGATLLPVAVLVVHQLRYLLAYGGHYGRELERRGDAGYTTWLIPVCAVLLALVLGAVLGRAAEAWRTGVGGRPARLTWGRLWCAVTLTLVLCFCVQEWLEILLEPSHAGTISGVFGSGGWTAVPAAAVIAAMLATLVRGASVVLTVIARRGRARRASSRRRVVPRGRLDLLERLVVPRPLARCSAGRAPPRIAAA